ncbi:MAG: hydroxymethylbilane synthase [Candidatus Nanopelagicales bacterium]|jgi:hydroxymethylbilane synthase
MESRVPEIRVATRASALARAQTAWVRERIRRVTGGEVGEVLITTEGDTSTAALTSFGGQGVFVAAVRQALIDGKADVAVHSMKDMPTADDPRTLIAAVPVREDVRDFLVTSADSLEALPLGARVGTGSPRRVAYLLRARPDLEVIAIRGNVDSRVARVTSGELDAVVLAMAGLNRLSLRPPGFPLDFDVMLPAVGQGALGVEMLRDHPAAATVGAISHTATLAAVTAERALLAGLRAGCSAPVGALADVTGGELELRAAVLSHDGSQMYECTTTGSLLDPEVGQRAAEDLIGQGAGRLLGENR